MSEFAFKAVIYKGPEDFYGDCGCGKGVAIFPILLPRAWLIEEKPREVEEDAFGTGFDYRRVSGFTCSRIFEHEMEGNDFLANYSCCPECAEKAVEQGYAVWSKKEYPMVLR